jgi:hypothetical protein
MKIVGVKTQKIIGLTTFIFCPAKSGHAIIGIPFMILSRLEFHPQ